MSRKRSSLFRQVRKRDPAPKHHHHVYVVQLKEDVAKLSRVKSENPNRNPELPCVYVGMTGLDPEERFQNHLKGIKSSYYVKNFAIKLLPDLYTYLNPMPFDAAVEMEKDLAEDLRSQGYTVTGGH